MSRGPGRIQRHIIDTLTHEREADPNSATWTRARDLTPGPTPTTAELESTRRAIRTLAAAGTIETRYRYSHDGRSLVARLPLSPAAQAQEAADHEALAEHLKAIAGYDVLKAVEALENHPTHPNP